MYRLIRILLVLSIVQLFAIEAPADTTRVVEIGPQTSLNGAWYDTDSGLAWVGGMNNTGVDSATMCSINGSDSVVAHQLTSLLPGSYGNVIRISRNGQFVAGMSESTLSQPYNEGTIWTFGDWTIPQGVGSLRGVSSSEVRGISDDGTTVGLSGLGFCKELAGSIQALPYLAGAGSGGVADDISADGATVVGNSEDSASNFVAVKWTAGEAFATPLDDPTSLFSGAVAISPDGSLIGGTAFDGLVMAACFWREDQIHYVLNADSDRFTGIVRSISDDGFYAGGGDFGGVLNAFVGHVNWPYVLTLEQWLQQNGYANPPALKEVRDLYHDGTHYHIAVNAEGGVIDSSFYVQTPDVGGNGGDVNDDGSVNVQDLLNLLSAWGPCVGCPEDIVVNGAVDVGDLLELLANWG